MQIRLEIQESAPDTVVTITCKKRDGFVERLLATLQMMDKQLVVVHNKGTTTLPLDEILYIESVDRKCFVYTSDKIYESCRKLYALEQQLEAYLFVRINKSAIVNVKQIDSIKTHVNRRLLITLSNGEQLIASRQYAERLKILLGVK